MPNRTITQVNNGSRGTVAEVLERCGGFASTVRIADAPARVRLRLRAQLAIVLAMTFEADSHEESRRVTDWARRSRGPHPLLGTHERVGRMEAIVASVIRARSGGGEWAVIGRTGASACAVALCLGSAADLPWSELESAQLAAVELGARFGLATILGPHLFEDAPCVAAVAGAVAASRVLGLPRERMSDAIARALAQPQISPFRARGVSRAAAATLEGVIAAELAFEGPSGLAVEVGGSLSFARGALSDLGKSWFAETIHIDEHAVPVSAQTAIDAAREVAAQARVSRGSPLHAGDVRSVELETTLFGAAPSVREQLAHAVSVTLQTTPERVRVRHAWDLTSALLFRVADAIQPSALFAGASMRELANAPAIVLRIADELGLEPPPLGQIASDLTRALSSRGGSTGVIRLAIPFANRVTLTTTDGARYAADRAVARGAPDASDDRVLSIARERFIAAAEKRIGVWRAQRAFESIVDPPARQTVPSFLERLAAV
jgi:hypothetical protein